MARNQKDSRLADCPKCDGKGIYEKTCDECRGKPDSFRCCSCSGTWGATEYICGKCDETGKVSECAPERVPKWAAKKVRVRWVNCEACESLGWLERSQMWHRCLVCKGVGQVEEFGPQFPDREFKPKCCGKVCSVFGRDYFMCNECGNELWTA